MFLQDCLTFPDLPTTTYIYIPGESYKAGVGTITKKKFGIDSTYSPQGTGKVKTTLVSLGWQQNTVPLQSVQVLRNGNE